MAIRFDDVDKIRRKYVADTIIEFIIKKTS